MFEKNVHFNLCLNVIIFMDFQDYEFSLTRTRQKSCKSILKAFLKRHGKKKFVVTFNNETAEI